MEKKGGIWFVEKGKARGILKECYSAVTGHISHKFQFTFDLVQFQTTNYRSVTVMFSPQFHPSDFFFA
jgi:hypothetical protein